MDDNSAAAKRWSNVMMMGATQAPTIQFRAAQGMRLVDADGKTYLDFLSGIAVNSLGHAHPAIVKAIIEQANCLSHVSNLYASEPPIRLAERLVELFPEGVGARVFFANSGAEANEAAFKIARRTGKTKIIAAKNSFHGRTMGALALTGQPSKQDPFEPLPGPVEFVDYGDIEHLRAVIDNDTAAVFLEAIQGEGGVVVPPDAYLVQVRQLTLEMGALLVIDEVQTGIGRTGKWFAHQHLGIQPDVVTSAKALGGGLPLGACIAFGPAAELLSGGQHASTFGGNPIACAAGLAVLDTIEKDGLLANATDMGKAMQDGIRTIGHPLVKEVRGIGLLIAIELTQPRAAEFERAALQHGFIVNAVQPSVVRLAPPLIITFAEVETFLEALQDLLDVTTT